MSPQAAASVARALPPPLALIMAGGTGGHVFPALALARELRSRSWQVVWLGTQRGLEARVVPAEHIPIEWLSVSGLRGKGVRVWFTAPLRLHARIAAGAGGDPTPAAHARGRSRRLRRRSRWGGGLAAAPAAADPRAECGRGLHQPLSRAARAARADRLSRQLSGRRARTGGRQSGATRDRAAAPAGAALCAACRRAAGAGARWQPRGRAPQRAGAVCARAPHCDVRRSTCAISAASAGSRPRVATTPKPV